MDRNLRFSFRRYISILDNITFNRQAHTQLRSRIQLKFDSVLQNTHSLTLIIVDNDRKFHVLLRKGTLQTTPYKSRHTLSMTPIKCARILSLQSIIENASIIQHDKSSNIALRIVIWIRGMCRIAKHL